MSSEVFDLNGRVCLVTGAGQGIGQHAARQLALHNAGGVVVNDFFADRAEKVAAQVTEAGGRAIAVQGDVSEFDDVQRMIDIATDEFGRVDVLVNNAGNMGPDPERVTKRPFWETDREEWDRWIAVNLFGVLNCTRAVLPRMVERGSGGRIITIISDAARVGEAGLSVYSGAKAGAAGFMRSVARETARFEITANCIAAGATRTPTIAAMLDDATEKAISRGYPLRRIGEPQDIASMVVFLASDAANWITGQTYPVNGGFSFNL